MKNVYIAIIFIILAGGVWYWYSAKPGTVSRERVANQENREAFDGRNSSFVINGQQITLIEGVIEQEAAPGSVSKITTRYFGNDAKGDLNFDGRDDVAFLVSQNTGGTGEFYYAVAAVATENGYRTTNAFLVGDRIAPQSTEIKSDSGELRINYADRKPGEPMTARPSQGKVLLLKVTPDGKLEGLMK